MGTDSHADGATRADALERRFLALNRDRLRRVLDTLTVRQRDFLEVLPLLFHVNHPLLPGFVGKDAPLGVADYLPSQPTLRAAHRVARHFEFERRSATRFAVRGLYMMGSPGTIAYTRDSDLDLWLLHDPDLDEAAVAQLRDKADRIERYAADIGLEAHFFVFDAERFRSGEMLSLSAESSGSSQHHLLLDEFYRSSLLLAGLKPLWWRVPTAQDEHYEDYIAEACRRGAFDRRDYLDFGALGSIPVEEFFGATVWQLYKSIDSPFKSVMKLLLMEAYAAEYPTIELLSRRFKAGVESAAVELNELDPYVLMYRKVEEHLRRRDDTLRLEVLRRSFYLKTNLRLSVRGADEWRGEALATLVQDWGWSTYQITRLDQRDGWRLDTALEERRDLISTLKDCYAALSRFAREYATDRRITEHDLHALGRRLYVAFEKKPAKIEVVTRGICVNPAESSLSLHELRQADGGSAWQLFAGIVKPGETGYYRPMKRTASATEMLLWCHMNRLYTPTTTWHVFCQGSELSAGEIRRVCECFDGALVGGPSPAALDARPHIARVLLLANVGVNPFSSALEPGAVLTTNRTDPFSFGGRRINLLRTLDLVFLTSWGETFTFHYRGSTALLDALAECMQWSPFDGSASELPVCTVRCFTSDYALQIAERVGRSFTSASRFFARNARAAPHFLLELDERLQHLALVDGKARVATLEGQGALFRALAEGDGARFNPVRFDHACTRAGLLPRIYALNRPGAVQVFAHDRGGRADVYVIDERGLLLVQRHDCPSMAQLLHHYRGFLDHALSRCVHLAGADGEAVVVETYELVVGNDDVQCRPHHGDAVAAVPCLSLQVLADVDAAGQAHFTIHANHREFSTWEHGGSLFLQVAEFVLAQRRNGEAYPIYITDLDLSRRFRESQGIATLRPYDLLSYKKRIEHQLTRALTREVAAPVALAS